MSVIIKMEAEFFACNFIVEKLIELKLTNVEKSFANK